MPKKVLVAIPPAMLAQIDQIAEIEHRTRSDLMREALRRYITEFSRNNHGSGVKPFITIEQRLQEDR